jgi:hypothetical protein
VEATPLDSAGGPLTPVRVTGVRAGTSDVVLASSPPLVIEGRFVLEDGTPFPPGAAVVEFRTHHPNGSLKSSTRLASAWSPDGSFRTQALDPDESYDIVVTHVPGRSGGAARGLRPGARDVEVVIRNGGRIEGRVLDLLGEPIPAGVTVEAHAKGGSWPAEPGNFAFTSTDADGRFVLLGLGDSTFRVSAGGHQSEFIPIAAPDLVAPGARNVELRLERGVSIEGRLVDANGAAPPKGVYVQVTRQGIPLPLDDEGRFAVRGLQPGRFSLFALVGTRVVELGEVAAPATGLTFTLPAK